MAGCEAIGRALPTKEHGEPRNPPLNAVNFDRPEHDGPCHCIDEKGRMTIDTWLRFGAVGLPLIGALAIWCCGARFPHAPRRLAVLLFGATALMALALFLLNRYYACILSFGRQNCLFDGSATLSLFLLGIALAARSFVQHGKDRERDYIPVLLLAGAWAGMGLAQSICLFLVCLNLFFFVLARWLKRKGIGGQFLMLRDDYKDDHRSGGE